MARGSTQSQGRAARSESKNEQAGIPKSLLRMPALEPILNPTDFAYDRADERTYRAFNSTKEEFESMVNSNEMRFVGSKSFTKTVTIKGEVVKIERVFEKAISPLDSQNNSGYGVRETYTVTKNGKEVGFWTHYGVNA